MRSRLGTYISLLFIVGWYFNSCRSTSPQAQISEFQVIDDQEQQQQSGADSSSPDNSRAMSLANENKLKRLHPKEPTAWFTRRLLMTTQQPSGLRINECKERVDATVKDAPNLKALDEVALSLGTKIAQSPNLYHWCFYQMMADLDIQLDKDTPLMQDKAEIFLARMRSLWALALALDSSGGDKVYMRYLRTRYTDINQNIFGRNLEVVDANSFSMPSAGGGKPAAEFEE